MPGQLSHLHIETGPAGWLKAFWRRDAGPDNVIYVRFRPPKSKRYAWAIVGLQASKDSSPPWLSSDLVRDVPLHRIEMALTASKVFKGGLLEKLDVEQPSDLDLAFVQTYEQAPREALKRPPRNQLTDEFFRDVATAYRRAVAAGLPPGKTIASDSGVPHGTVARWIAEARERKFLPPAQQGRISADEEGTNAS